MRWNPFKKRSFQGLTPQEYIQYDRFGLLGRNQPIITEDSALKHSAVFACLRLRSDLVSTMPVDVYRKVNGIQVEMPKPPVLISPDGRLDLDEWLYATQFDLDRAGNVFGIITQTNALGLPARIELQPLSECSVILRQGVLSYRIAGKEYSPDQVWHERQFVVPGLPYGLSPIQYAALEIGQYLTIQDFATNWYANSPVPKGLLRKTDRTMTPEQAAEMKQRFKNAQMNGDVFVTGNDWEYSPNEAQKMTQEWVTGKQWSVTDVCRFLGVPGDLIDSFTPSGTITYATITQRNLQLLIMNIGPAVVRRERALSKLLPQPRFVKFNTDALLRMDPENQSQTLRNEILAKYRTPNEARALKNLPPLTEAQYAEFDRLFPEKTKTPAVGGAQSDDANS